MAKIKKVNKKPRDPGRTKNPYLGAKGGFNLVERFPGIDFMIYEKERKAKKKKVNKKCQYT